ncbi:MAG: DNA-processing protein DprA [Vulcanimicrobiaceae bacterium]
MDQREPAFVGREELEGLRPARAGRLRCEGLWVAGSLVGLRGPAVALVGTRAPSDGARSRARVLGEALGRAGVAVVSGLALGIDGAGHAGALAGGGPTIGVLGGGHRAFYPLRNVPLAEAMLAAGGAVVSPFPPDEPARPPQFLMRNAIVAAFADALVVVEAAARSGALNSASWAASFGIDVLAYPGDVDRPKVAGCNALIRDGATLVRGPEDVLEALGVRAPLAPDGAGEDRALERTGAGATFEPAAQALLRALAAGPCGYDELAERLALPAAKLLATVVELELAGALVCADGRAALAPRSGAPSR